MTNEPADTLVSVAVSASDKRGLRLLAHQRDQSMSALIRGLLREALTQQRAAA